MAKSQEVATEATTSAKRTKTVWTVPSESRTDVTISVPASFSVNGKDFSLANFTGEVLSHLLIHGLGQKVGDAAAMTKDEMAGKTDAEVQAAKWEAVTEAAEKLARGDLSKSRGGGSGGLTLQGVAVMVALQNAASKGIACTQKQAADAAKKYLSTPEGEAKIKAKLAEMKATAADDDIEMLFD